MQVIKSLILTIQCKNKNKMKKFNIKLFKIIMIIPVIYAIVILVLAGFEIIDNKILINTAYIVAIANLTISWLFRDKLHKPKE